MVGCGNVLEHHNQESSVFSLLLVSRSIFLVAVGVLRDRVALRPDHRKKPWNEQLKYSNWSWPKESWAFQPCQIAGYGGRSTAVYTIRLLWNSIQCWFRSRVIEDWSVSVTRYYCCFIHAVTSGLRSSNFCVSGWSTQNTRSRQHGRRNGFSTPGCIEVFSIFLICENRAILKAPFFRVILEWSLLPVRRCRLVEVLRVMISLFFDH